MKLTELKDNLTKPITREDRLLGPVNIPPSICYPFTHSNRSYEGIDVNGEYTFVAGRVLRRIPVDAHLGAVED